MGFFSHFLNCTNGTKSRNTSHMSRNTKMSLNLSQMCETQFRSAKFSRYKADATDFSEPFQRQPHKTALTHSNNLQEVCQQIV